VTGLVFLRDVEELLTLARDLRAAALAPARPATGAGRTFVRSS